MESLPLKKRLLISVVGGVLLCLVTAGVTLVSLLAGTYTTSWGEKIRRSESYLYIDGQTLSQEDLAQIAGLKSLRRLELTNCNVAECRLPELEFASGKLYGIDLSGTKGLWDLSFLSHLQASDLDLSDCPGVDSLEQLNWEVLERLNVDGTAVTDLSPVAGSRLYQLSFAHTQVSDLAPLAGLEDLNRVDGSYTQVSSLDALAQARWLYELRFDGCPIQKLSRPLTASCLQKVSLAQTPVSSLAGLAGCSELEELDLSGCAQVRSMDWLDRENYETLRSLDLSGTGLAAKDIRWVGACRRLEHLGIDGIELGDLSLCDQLGELTYLSAVGCGLTSVRGIGGCQKIETLLLGYNRLTSLKGLPALRHEWADVVLDLSHNGLASLADLPEDKYRCLLLHGNAADLTCSMPEGVTAYELTASWHEGIEQGPLRDYDRASRIYLLDCPVSEVTAVDGAFGSYRVRRLGEPELWELLEADALDYHLYVDMGGYVAYARDHA